MGKVSLHKMIPKISNLLYCPNDKLSGLITKKNNCSGVGTSTSFLEFTPLDCNDLNFNQHVYLLILPKLSSNLYSIL